MGTPPHARPAAYTRRQEGRQGSTGQPMGHAPAPGHNFKFMVAGKGLARHQAPAHRCLLLESAWPLGAWQPPRHPTLPHSAPEPRYCIHRVAVHRVNNAKGWVASCAEQQTPTNIHVYFWSGGRRAVQKTCVLSSPPNILWTPTAPGPALMAVDTARQAHSMFLCPSFRPSPAPAGDALGLHSRPKIAGPKVSLLPAMSWHCRNLVDGPAAPTPTAASACARTSGWNVSQGLWAARLLAST